MPTRPTTDTYADALARAAAYTDAVGLSDGTDRPAQTAAQALADAASADLADLVAAGIPAARAAKMVDNRLAEALRAAKRPHTCRPGTMLALADARAAS